MIHIRKESIDALAANNADIKSWQNLCSSTLAHLIVLNRCRTGEASKLMLKHVHEMQEQSEINDEVNSPFQVQLSKTFKRVEVNGKRGIKVYILLTKELAAAIQLLVNTRETVGINENNVYVFAIATRNSTQFVCGNDALRKHSKLCHMKHPEYITSTNLRKHFATLSQCLVLEKRELDVLASFGWHDHDLKINFGYYCLPGKTMETAQYGKLLLKLEQQGFEDLSGKLKEIENGKNLFCVNTYHVYTLFRQYALS